ncbi:uncharacterized protein [Periplaneta americana]|uniref:uncharacterized protein isoform X3 n=1 Tax=Periplaneta americana TaxID=6978 RepID=UPI0037E76C96
MYYEYRKMASLEYKVRYQKFATVEVFFVPLLSILAFSSIISGVNCGIIYDMNHGGALTREIEIKQGKLIGVRLEPTSQIRLQPVDVFLGIPYAAAPTGSQRFMPPGSPPQWMGTKLFHNFGPVCPQNLPDLNEKEKNRMPEGRANYLRRLFPYLTENQSEDCLYLNIYAPAQKGGMTKSNPKYPVIVFIHGESFEWNSGNLYDGSILASFGGVVVVTLNFRLGILGFLRPGVGEHTVSNFGLLDQIAALQWIKENIQEFGGDPNSVTLMGHGTGAACVNYLMVSPVSQGMHASGLFRRAILMSGTALADWALTTSSVITIQVAQALNCALKDTNNEMASCLRKKRLEEIMDVKVEVPEFKTRFGPMVDGSVVPNDPFQLIGVYKDLFSRFELLYGVTELESYNLLDAVSLQYGMLEQDRDKKIRSYVQERFQYLPDLSLAETLKAYNVTRRRTSASSQSIAETNRDILLDVLSDARVAAPMVQTANFHSSVNPQSYFYVFSHTSSHGHYTGVKIDKSIHGEELPYVFGVPLGSGMFPSHYHYNEPERQLSQAIMTFWTNFAKTGNPNAPRRERFLTRKDLEWPEYDIHNQTYFSLGFPLRIAHRYRQNILEFWNNYEPDFKNDKEVMFDGNECTTTNSSATVEELEDARTTSMAKSIVVVIGICLLLINLCAFAGLYYQRDRLRAQERLMKRLYAGVEQSNNQVVYIKHATSVKNNALQNFENKMPGKLGLQQSEEGIYEIVSSRNRVQEVEGATEGEDGDESSWRLSRHCSASTMDTHTKVKEWIERELVDYCPKINNKELSKNGKVNNSVSEKLKYCEIPATHVSPTTLQIAVCHDPVLYSTATSKPTTTTSISKSKVTKVSVAVDATPTARIASMLSKPMDENSGELLVSTAEIAFQQDNAYKNSSDIHPHNLSTLSSSLCHEKSINSENKQGEKLNIPEETHSSNLQDSVNKCRAFDVPQAVSGHEISSDKKSKSKKKIFSEFDKNKNVNMEVQIPDKIQETKTVATKKTADIAIGSVHKRDVGTTTLSNSNTGVKASLKDDTTEGNHSLTKQLPTVQNKTVHPEKEAFEREWALINAMTSRNLSFPPPTHPIVRHRKDDKGPTETIVQKETEVREKRNNLPSRRRVLPVIGRKSSITNPFLQSPQLESLQETVELPSPASYNRKTEVANLKKPKTVTTSTSTEDVKGQQETLIHSSIPSTSQPLSGVHIAAQPQKEVNFPLVPFPVHKISQAKKTDASTETCSLQKTSILKRNAPVKESIGTSTSSLLQQEEADSNSGTIKCAQKKNKDDQNIR